MRNRSYRGKMIIGVYLPLAMILLFTANILFGPVIIPLDELFRMLTGKPADIINYNIVFKSRIPNAITACLAGAGLSVSGLMLQTMFRNPLAGPSVLGITSGAELGVALVTLLFTGPASVAIYSGFSQVSTVFAAFIGSMGVIILILLFAGKVKDNAILLIIGLMISYLASSVISVLNYFGQQDAIHAYVIWGLGSFSNNGWEQLRLFSLLMAIGLSLSFLSAKMLNLMNLGEIYARNLGLNMKRARFFIIVITGLLAAVVTAYCGPIAFIGLAVPHISRLTTASTDHKILIPVTILNGAVLALLCNLIAKMPGLNFTLPINAVTSLFGAPLIIYIIIRRKHVYE